MEFPRGAVSVERVLAALALAAALATAWAEAGSPLAQKTREGKPWLAWIGNRTEGPAAGAHLLIYDPARRRLHVVDARGQVPSDAAGAAQRLPAPLPAAAPDEEPALAAARAIEEEVRSPRSLLRLAGAAARGLRRGDRAAADPLLLALELRRAPKGSVEPARLAGGAQDEALLRRLLSGGAPPAGRGGPISAEVLNGTAEAGLAARAAKMLRLGGVDVLLTGGTSPRPRTLVYDRTGDFRRAERALAALGCGRARAVTRLDPARAVDVSVELGSDCVGAFQAGGGRD
ncbi:MAG: LytR C-terminal domain-containing protein [Elusimicrobia bacterium]|nr:LytR C-terminal domain-containing protein [Elusimicrobiota bacterium]